MKTTKRVLLACAGLATAAFLVGAKYSGTSRPGHISAERWVSISDTAGIALTDELAATQQLAGSIYVRTEKGWRSISILNPATGQLLNDDFAARRQKR